MRTRITLLVLLLLATVACNRGDDEAASTTALTLAGSSATTIRSGSATQSDSQATTTPSTAPLTNGSTPAAVDPIAYEVASLKTMNGGVDALIVVVGDEEYTFDEMENLMRDIVEEYPAANSVRVVSDLAAVGAASRYDTADALAEDVSLLEEHFLVELVDGIRLIFRGPYEPMGQASLGS